MVMGSGIILAKSHPNPLLIPITYCQVSYANLAQPATPVEEVCFEEAPASACLNQGKKQARTVLDDVNCRLGDQGEVLPDVLPADAVEPRN